MPEGPEVETIRLSLVPSLLGQRLGKARVSKKALREPTSSRALAFLEGAVVDALGRHGKLLWIAARGGGGLLVRLGMTGRLVVEPSAQRAPPHTHVDIPLPASGTSLRFTDPRRFGSVLPFADDAALQAEVARMGPDGLSLDDAAKAAVAKHLRETARSLKDALLDQSLVAGVGNIYASEALFFARLSPFLRGVDLDDAGARRLLDAVADVLGRAVDHRGTTFSNYVDGTGRGGDNLDYLAVFQRDGEPCRVCQTAIVRVTQGQRTTYLCPSCQQRPPARRGTSQRRPRLR